MKNILPIRWILFTIIGIGVGIIPGIVAVLDGDPLYKNSTTLTYQSKDGNSEAIAETPVITSVLRMPIIMNEWCPRVVGFSSVPAYGSFDDLQGWVSCVKPQEYKVAVYIFVSGWWTKPYWVQPLTTIQEDSTWTCDITTGGTDQLATKIAAFLVPNGYDPPSMSGGQTLPAELYVNSAAYNIIDREPIMRKITFSGLTWNVKASETPAGPGPNYFSDDEHDIWVDADARLHLKIVYRNNRWYCTEVYTTVPMGFGTYTYTLASRVDQLDRNVVLGLFTWDDTAPQFNYREIDIEFSRWGETAGMNSQYVVSPWTDPGNRHRFNTVIEVTSSTHWFDWSNGSTHFSSYQGKPPNLGNLIEEWSYTGPDTPPEGQGNARINLWLLNGWAPSDGHEVEVIVDSFQYSR